MTNPDKWKQKIHYKERINNCWKSFSSFHWHFLSARPKLQIAPFLAEHFRDASASIVERVIRFKAFHFRITISALNVWALTDCNHYYIDEHVWWCQRWWWRFHQWWCESRPWVLGAFPAPSPSMTPGRRPGCPHHPHHPHHHFCPDNHRS